MAGDSPASILFDIDGNPVGVILDGVIYRLQVEASLAPNAVIKITDGTNTVGITDVSGNKALKVDVIKTVSSGGVGSGGTSSNFEDPFPIAGTAAGFNDGYNLQGAYVFDLDTDSGKQYVLGVNLRTSASGGSVDFGTSNNPIKVDTAGNAFPVSIVESPEGAQKILYDIGNTIIYIGTALQGTASNAAAWLIKKTTLDGSGNPVSTLWSTNVAVWDNRGSETYQ